MRTFLLLVCLLILAAGWLAWKVGFLQFNAGGCVDVADIIPGENSIDTEICVADD